MSIKEKYFFARLLF